MSHQSGSCQTPGQLYRIHLPSWRRASALLGPLSGCISRLHTFLCIGCCQLYSPAFCFLLSAEASAQDFDFTKLVHLIPIRETFYPRPKIKALKTLNDTGVLFRQTVQGKPGKQSSNLEWRRPQARSPHLPQDPRKVSFGDGGGQV